MNQVLSFSSGKGGVGKTTLVANLGALFAASGRRTLLVDGDWSLGKLCILLGVRPTGTIDRVLSGKASLLESIHPVRENLSLLASPSGVVGFEELSPDERNHLFFEIDALRDRYDVILLDHGSGIHAGVLQFAAAAHSHFIVTTPEPTSYTDAYAIMKVLSQRFAIREFRLLVTQTRHGAETAEAMARFCDVVRGHLAVRITESGTFPWDARVSESICQRRLFVDRHPDSELTRLFRSLQSQIERTEPRVSSGLSFFHENSLPAR